MWKICTRWKIEEIGVASSVIIKEIKERNKERERERISLLAIIYDDNRNKIIKMDGEGCNRG